MKVVEKKLRGEGIEEAGETEGARRATGVFPAGAPLTGVAGEEKADVEVVAKAERRRFTAEYKRWTNGVARCPRAAPSSASSPRTCG